MGSRLKTLGLSLLTLVQLALAAVLLAYVYTPVLVIVGALNFIWVLITGSSFDNIDLLFEPGMWYYHQLMVLFGASKEFRPAPYV